MSTKKVSRECLEHEYLKTLEEVKKQYQQYVEVSKLYELPIFQPEKEAEMEPPSLKNPLTTNTILVK